MVSAFQCETVQTGSDRFLVHGIMYGEVYNGWATGFGLEREFRIL